jgi:hypothetical protein
MDVSTILEALHIARAVIAEGLHEDRSFRREALIRINDALVELGAQPVTDDDDKAGR